MTVDQLIDHLRVLQSSGHGSKVIAVPDIQGAIYQDVRDVRLCAFGLGSRREEVVLVY